MRFYFSVLEYISVSVWIRVSIGEKQLRPGWTLLLKNKFSKQDRPKRYTISPARSSILTLYHVLASELLRSSSLVGKGRERNEVLNKISKFFGGPLEKFEKWLESVSKPIETLSVTFSGSVRTL